jgi:hypothetical protein
MTTLGGVRGGNREEPPYSICLGIMPVLALASGSNTVDHAAPALCRDRGFILDPSRVASQPIPGRNGKIVTGDRLSRLWISIRVPSGRTRASSATR